MVYVFTGGFWGGYGVEWSGLSSSPEGSKVVLGFGLWMRYLFYLME